MTVVVGSGHGFNGSGGENTGIFCRSFEGILLVLAFLGISESSFEIGDSQIISRKNAFYIG